MPLVGTLSPNENSAALAEKITSFLNENSLDEVQEYFERMKALMSCYQCALLEVETKFKVLNEQFSLNHERNPIESIKTRMKSSESIREKLQRRNLPFSFDSLDKIYDIAGIRIICSFVDDIYMLADCLLKQDDVRLIERKDYIANPKENGYRSLHLIIEVPIFLQDAKRLMKVEVQLRTIAMEFWANLEHKLRYKKNLPGDVAMLTAEELTQCAQMSAQLDLKMQKVRDVIENA
ncbi:MAG: GTP pyrophosphokinase family protein [Lachnospiraceae bacterium]|nr:GTP pyrophosphokinase family protein [Lachnospiraceae bacterium]